MTDNQRAFYASPPSTSDAVDLTTDQTVAGEKTLTDRLAAEGDAQLGPDTNNLLAGALGDTSGVWLDAVLGSSNPNVSVHVRAKGPSGVIALESPTTVTGGLTVDGNVVDPTTKQPLDSDLTAIAALAPSNDDIVQRKAGAWTNRTIAQLKTDLGYGTAAALTAGGASGAATLDSNTKLTRSQLPVIGNVRNDLESGSYWAVPTMGSTQSAAMTANRAYALSMIPSVDGTLSDFGIDCTAVATGGNVRGMVYASSGGRPAALIVDLGQQAAPTGGIAMMWWTVSQAVTAGVEYYLVVAGQGLTGSPTFRQRNTNAPEISFGTSRPTTLGGSFCAYYSDTGFSGAAPTPFGAVAGSVAAPVICFKIT